MGEQPKISQWTNLMWVADREDSEHAMCWGFSENTVCLGILWCWSRDKGETCSCTTAVTERGDCWSLRQTERKKTQCNSKGNNKQNEKTTYGMGENICKWCHQQGFNFQNIQIAHTAQYQKINPIGTSLVVQWLRLCAPNAGGLSSIPGQGTRSHMLQVRVLMQQWRSHMLQLRPCATK